MRKSGLDGFAKRHPFLESALRPPYRAFYRAFRPSNLITATVAGATISADAAQRDLALILHSGEWEPRQTRLFESLLRPGMNFVDVGAHIGYYSILAARRVGPSGRVYAFEPAPSNFRLLETNIAQNHVTNIVAEQAAVARETGRATFALSCQDSASHTLAISFVRSADSIEVPTVSLDSYFGDDPARIDVVKLDAEGAEAGILQGMTALLERNPEVIIFTEIYPRAMEAFGSSPGDFLRTLDRLGFGITPFEEKSAPGIPLEPEHFDGFLAQLRSRDTGANLLCRKKSEAKSDQNRSTPAASSKLLVSVAIPTYNRGALLDQTLRTILPQLPADFEIVICDTGSTDDSAQRIAQTAAGDARVRYCFLSERLNLDEALLELLKLSRGEYVWFFSSDDHMKAGAADSVRERILNSPERPALVYVNQQILDEAGHTLIASQVGCNRDRNFRDGRDIVSWLGLDLGFISASAIRRETALGIPSSADFVGTRSLNLHLYIECLLRGGAAFYIGTPLIAARRASGAAPYDVCEVFVRQIVRIFSHARKRGLGWFRTQGAMQKTILRHYLRLVVSWRADNPAEVARTFPEMLRACWMYPAFWLLLFPVRMAPRGAVRVVRNRLRDWRAARNARSATSDALSKAADKCAVADPATSLRMPFRALLRVRKLTASLGTDRLFKAAPFVVSAYRRIYAFLAPRQTVRVKFRGHTLYLDLSDQVVARSLITMGTWEEYETQVFSDFVKEGMVVVDIGANVGHYTLEAARRVGKTGRVFAFEPEPHNFELLRRNIEANGYTNIVPVQKALSNRAGTSWLELSSENLGAHHVTRSPKGDRAIQVETTTLDEFLRDQSWKVDLLKMDAEGAEALILEGMREVLAASPDLILFAEYMPRAIAVFGTKPEQFLRKLADAGFSLRILDDESERFNVITHEEIDEITLPLLDPSADKFHINFLCVRGRSAAQTAQETERQPVAIAAASRDDSSAVPSPELQFQVASASRGKEL